MSQAYSSSSAQDAVPVTCIYCGHHWLQPVVELERQDWVLYRHDPAEDNPDYRREYLVECPKCSRRMTVTIRIKGA